MTGEMLNDEIINELVEGLQNILGDKLYCIILYGSVARKEATEESDIDIALVLKDKFDEESKERFLIWNSSLDMKYNKIFSITALYKI